MNIFVIGSAPAVWGFALAGVEGRTVETADEVQAALDAALGQADIGIVLITEDVASLARDRVDQLIVRSEVPLVVEIPGPEGPSPDYPLIQDLLQRAIGVKE